MREAPPPSDTARRQSVDRRRHTSDLAFQEEGGKMQEKKTIAQEKLHEIIRRIVEVAQPEKIILFGSAARGEMGPHSDVDLLVVGETSFGDVVAAVRRAEERLGRDVNPTVYSANEFRVKVRAKHHFLTTVLSEPRMFVVGGDEELLALRANGLAEETENGPERDRNTTADRRTRPRRQDR